MNPNTPPISPTIRSLSDEKLAEVLANRAMYNPQMVAECEQEIAIRAAAQPLFEKCRQMSNKELLNILNNPGTYSPEALYCSQTILRERRSAAEAAAAEAAEAAAKAAEAAAAAKTVINTINEPTTDRHATASGTAGFSFQNIINKIIVFIKGILGSNTPGFILKFENLNEKSSDEKQSCLKNTSTLFGAGWILYFFITAPLGFLTTIALYMQYNCYSDFAEGFAEGFFTVQPASNFINTLIALAILVIITIVSLFMCGAIETCTTELHNEDRKKIKILQFSLIAIVALFLVLRTASSFASVALSIFDYGLIIYDVFLLFLKVIPKLLSLAMIAGWVVVAINSVNLKNSATLPEKFKKVFAGMSIAAILSSVGYFVDCILYFIGNHAYDNTILLLANLFVSAIVILLICAGAFMFIKAWRSLK